MGFRYTEDALPYASNRIGQSAGVRIKAYHVNPSQTQSSLPLRVRLLSIVPPHTSTCAAWNVSVISTEDVGITSGYIRLELHTIVLGRIAN